MGRDRASETMPYVLPAFVVPRSIQAETYDAPGFVGAYPVPLAQRRIGQPAVVVEPVRSVRGFVERHQRAAVWVGHGDLGDAAGVPGRRRDRCRALGDTRDQPGRVHRGNGRIARRPLEGGAGHRVPVRVERLRREPQRVAEPNRGRRRRHDDRTRRLHHGHERLPRGLARARRDRSRAAADRRDQSRGVDRCHQRVRARPSDSVALHHATDLIPHLRGQLRRLPQCRQRHRVGRHRDDGRRRGRHRERRETGHTGGCGRDLHLARRHPGHEAGIVHTRHQRVRRRPRDRRLRHRPPVRVGRLGRKAQRVALDHRVRRR